MKEVLKTEHKATRYQWQVPIYQVESKLEKFHLSL